MSLTTVSSPARHTRRTCRRGSPAARALLTTAILGSLGATALATGMLRRPDWLDRPPADPPSVPEYVSILLPLTGDPPRVEGCLRALLGQVRLERTEIVALDDGASAATVAEVRRVVEDDPRVRMLTAAAPPNGWARRTSACHQLAVAARGSVYVYVDPDVVLERHAIAATVTLLRQGSVQLLAPVPRQAAPPPYLATRLPRGFTRPGGRLLAVDARSYWRSGGHSVAADLPRDDAALAVAIRRSGGRCAFADGSSIAMLPAPVCGADGHGRAHPPGPQSGAGTLGDTAWRKLLAMVRALSHE